MSASCQLAFHENPSSSRSAFMASDQSTDIFNADASILNRQIPFANARQWTTHKHYLKPKWRRHGSVAFNCGGDGLLPRMSAETLGTRSIPVKPLLSNAMAIWHRQSANGRHRATTLSGCVSSTGRSARRTRDIGISPITTPSGQGEWWLW